MSSLGAKRFFFVYRDAVVTSTMTTATTTTTTATVYHYDYAGGGGFYIHCVACGFDVFASLIIAADPGVTETRA